MHEIVQVLPWPDGQSKPLENFFTAHVLQSYENVHNIGPLRTQVARPFARRAAMCTHLSITSLAPPWYQNVRHKRSHACLQDKPSTVYYGACMGIGRPQTVSCTVQEVAAWLNASCGGAGPFLLTTALLMAEVARGGDGDLWPWLSLLPPGHNCLLAWTPQEQAALAGCHPLPLPSPPLPQHFSSRARNQARMCSSQDAHPTTPTVPDCAHASCRPLLQTRALSTLSPAARSKSSGCGQCFPLSLSQHHIWK